MFGGCFGSFRVGGVVFFLSDCLIVLLLFFVLESSFWSDGETWFGFECFSGSTRIDYRRRFGIIIRIVVVVF